MEGHEVVVIGAGIAGLAATAALVDRGVDVVCVEARDRPGGRLLSAGPLDLGATWFWPGERRVRDLVERTGIAVFDQHLTGDAVYESPTAVNRVKGNSIDVPAFRYVDGAASLATALATKVPLRFGAPVTAVSADPAGLRVTTSEAVFRAQHVIMAVPPALAVSFAGDALSPELMRLAAKTPVWMGAVTKVVVRYAEPFWREQGLAGAAISMVGPLREIHDMSGPGGNPAALFGFAVGEVSAQAAVAQLVRLYGNRAASPEQVHIQDWSREPWTSPPDVHARADYSWFGHPLYTRPAADGRLHWASTETATAFAGHVEGALAASVRAVAATTGNR
ncbi:flavin monoamine oxidase family protein [Kutzneria sp. CA-103260]|uniref:flavin monoamine oxidase family protein n=1 Tax=Kutzneria sp. CA-103260 TaxID=2802641 RepID=UPI001BAB1795|nr:FAD-dependent oxidoreductase [Kutzneria sp. CA-103260]